jgi:3-hydroxyacyl-CoA dehydrogenase
MLEAGLTITDVGDVRVLTIAAPPSNHLSPGLRAGLIAAIATPPPTVGRIVLAASGATFSSGLPIEPDTALPTLAMLCQAVETSVVPVVAALHGLVLGPGAELALAARARVAAPGTRIAFPEVALGVCPEGGTSRRLACRVGIAAALGLILSGRAIATDEALALGLIDAEAAEPVSTAQRMVLPAVMPAVPRADAGAISEARRLHIRASPATGRIIACIEAAALLPPEMHQAFEAVAREDLEASPEAAALRWVAKAERRALAMPAALSRLRPEVPERIALHGAAPDLVTLARLALARGLEVAWHHPDAVSAKASLAALDLAEAVEQRAGRLGAAARAAGRARLTVGGDALLHIHSDPPADTAPGGPVRLVLGDGGGHPGLAIAPQGTSCELSLPPDGPAAGPALALVTLRRMGLQPILVGARPILGRGLVAAGRSALAVMATFVPKREIARALEGFGVALTDRLPETSAARPDIGPEEILDRWLGALANEGFRLMNQGIARRPSDIDLVLVQGYGFPRWRGGPMHLADRRGLMALRRDLRRWAVDDPLWSPSPLLDRLIRDGQRLEAQDPSA